MNNIKILHISIDEKFVDHAIPLFEIAFPGSNDVFVLSRTAHLAYVKLQPNKIIPIKSAYKRTPKIARSEYEKYDLVVFHSFGDLIYPEIYQVPKSVPSVWLGWGYDYYDLIVKPHDLLLPETKKIATRALMSKLKSRALVGKILGIGFGFLGISKSRKSAIEKVDIFSPVLPGEYHMVYKANKWNSFPESAQWNYGTIEDNLIKGFESAEVEGDAILVGNSASVTSNHYETFMFLSEVELKDRKIISPLSYGDKYYGRAVAEVGKKYFGEFFNPLMDFIPVEEYVSIIRKCGYVIMNHKRQQAVGNIVIMLYLGARVFLREENPTYSFLKEMGVSLSSIQDLEKDHKLLDNPLSVRDRETNRRLVGEYWSRERAIARTKKLVKQALSKKSLI